MSGKKYNKDKLFAKITHTASSGVVGQDEYEVYGEINLKVVTTFTASGTLTLQGRIHHSDTWETIGTLSSGGDNDSFDISLVDYVRFNFTVAAGSTGEIAASGFFKGATASGGGASASFTTIQTDSGTSPVATGATDTLTLTSTGGSVTIVGTAGTDTIDIEAIGLENGSGTTTLDSESAAPTSGQVLTANSATDMTWQTPTAVVYSNPNGSYANSEHFGASSAVTAVDSTAFGNLSSAGSSGTAIGYRAVASGQYGVCTGRQSNALGQWSQAIGSYITVSHNSSVIIGGNTASRAANECMIGGGSCTFSSIVFGQGPATGAPSVLSFSMTDAQVGLTDIAGANWTIKGSVGTGSGIGGHLIFQTAAAGTTGTAANTLTTQLELTDDGNVIMPNLPTSATGLPTGALWDNSGVINIA